MSVQSSRANRQAGRVPHGAARRYILLVGVAAAVLVQSTLLSRVRLFGAWPNLVLVLVICWSMRQTLREGIVGAFLAGLGLDLIGGMPLGTSSLALMFACLLTGIGSNSVFASNILLPIVLVGMATPVHGWIVLLTQQLRGQDIEWIATTLRVMGPELVLNVALVPLVYPLLRSTGRVFPANRGEF